MVHDRALRGIDLNLLVVLRCLLLERHVTRAAQKLALSQSATSHALSRLREIFGDPLLVRSGRGLVPTPRAVELLPRLEKGLSELTSAVSGEPPFDPATARRTFTLGMGDYEQAILLGPLLSRLEREAPTVDLHVLPGLQLVELLDEGRVDLALMVGSVVPPNAPRQRLVTERFACMVRRGHPLVKKRLTLQRYLELRHLLVAPRGSAGSVIDTELERLGKKRRVALRVPNFVVVPIVVSGSDLVNTGPERLARRAAEIHPVVVLPAPFRTPRFEVFQVWHPRHEKDPAHEWLRRCIAEVSASV